MSRIKNITFLSFVFFLVAHLNAEEGFSVGDRLPSIDKYNLSGDIPQIEGKVVMIDFWASWCAPCKASFPSMDEVYTKYKEQGFEILAVSVDKKQGLIDRFTQKMTPSFSILWDKDQSLVSAAKVSVMPTSILVDRQGVIRYIHTGWHGKKSIAQLEKELSELLEEGI